MLGNAPIVALLPCVDIAGARKFYEDVLGLTEIERSEAGQESALGVLYECGEGTRLAIYERSTPTVADHTAAGWVVKDVDAVADALIAKGVTFEVYDLPGVEYDDRGVATLGSSRGAWFKDPEGNILSISDFS
jgi:catechol 2,3-dioxygenase-like lactoylglutathione lyase family enzyme